eukprot:CAMPEP_0194054256 /NCGR_PEP_ID=MMETSP0009_2-20130614/52832_1 /TAXON_ID=210454 /ORGANISM="Grammatophora oceanica, Strain CCMP 410" /LENGTH=203 /DNA_ID=CAMNT_0038702689 /DNA_START=87 /DNA_END=698 /DNA_ORIENTATION=+
MTLLSSVERVAGLLTLFMMLLPKLAHAEGDFCATGFIMDQYCIDEERMIDNGRLTLVEPEEHSIHCLVDVGRCVESPFEILAEPKNADGEYTRVAELDEDGKEKAIMLARSVGSCSTCTGDGDQRKGFRATVKGTLDPTTTLAEVPRVLVTEVLPDTVPCPDAPTVAPGTTSAPTAASDANKLSQVVSVSLAFMLVGAFVQSL